MRRSTTADSQLLIDFASLTYFWSPLLESLNSLIVFSFSFPGKSLAFHLSHTTHHIASAILSIRELDNASFTHLQSLLVCTFDRVEIQQTTEKQIDKKERDEQGEWNGCFTFSLYKKTKCKIFFTDNHSQTCI